MENQFATYYKKKLMIVRILWMALLMSICMFPVILFVVKSDPVVMNFDALLKGEDTTLVILAVVAAAIAASTFFGFDFYKNKVIRQRWDRAGFLKELKEATGENGERLHSDAEIEFASKLDDRGLGLYRLHSRLMIAHIIRFALTESIAILGFLAATLVSNPALFIPFGFVSIVLMLCYFPKSEINTQVI